MNQRQRPSDPPSRNHRRWPPRTIGDWIHDFINASAPSAYPHEACLALSHRHNHRRAASDAPHSRRATAYSNDRAISHRSLLRSNPLQMKSTCARHSPSRVAASVRPSLGLESRMRAAVARQLCDGQVRPTYKRHAVQVALARCIGSYRHTKRVHFALHSPRFQDSRLPWYTRDCRSCLLSGVSSVHDGRAEFDW